MTNKEHVDAINNSLAKTDMSKDELKSLKNDVNKLLSNICLRINQGTHVATHHSEG